MEILAYAQKKHLGIMGGHNQVKVTNGHQVQRYMISFKRDVEIWLAQWLII